jgi:hypothetical protein
MALSPKKGTTQKPTGQLRLRRDDDPNFEVLGAFVRVGVLVWSGVILTLTYVQIPGLPQQKIDPTFIASIFTASLATFGVQKAANNSGGTPQQDLPSPPPSRRPPSTRTQKDKPD